MCILVIYWAKLPEMKISTGLEWSVFNELSKCVVQWKGDFPKVQWRGLLYKKTIDGEKISVQHERNLNVRTVIHLLNILSPYGQHSYIGSQSHIILWPRMTQDDQRWPKWSKMILTQDDLNDQRWHNLTQDEPGLPNPKLTILNILFAFNQTYQKAVQDWKARSQEADNIG